MRLQVEKLLWSVFILLLPAQTAIHFWPSFSYFQGLRVDYLSPTLYLTDIIIIALLLVRFPQLPKFRKSYLFILLLVILNIFFSLQPVFTIYKYIRSFMYLIFLFAFVQSSGKFKSKLPVLFLFSGLWLSLLAIFQFLSQRSLGSLFKYLGERPLGLEMLNVAKISLGNFGLFLRSYATFPHPNALAGYLLVSVLILISFKNKFAYSPKLYFSVLALMIMAIIFTFSRSVIILLLISALIVALKNQHQVRFLCICFALLVSIPLSFNYGSVSSFTERMELIKVSESVLIHHPLIGIGLGNYSLSSAAIILNNPFLSYQPVHNIYLLLLTELGIPLFLCFILVVWKYLKSYFIAADIYFKLALLNILTLGFIDHYWVTSHQNTLLLVLLASLFIVRSKDLSL